MRCVATIIIFPFRYLAALAVLLHDGCIANDMILLWLWWHLCPLLGCTSFTAAVSKIKNEISVLIMWTVLRTRWESHCQTCTHFCLNIKNINNTFKKYFDNEFWLHKGMSFVYSVGKSWMRDTVIQSNTVFWLWLTSKYSVRGCIPYQVPQKEQTPLTALPIPTYIM